MLSCIPEGWYNAESPEPGSAGAGVSRVSSVGGAGCSARSQWQEARAARQSRGAGRRGAAGSPALGTGALASGWWARSPLNASAGRFNCILFRLSAEQPQLSQPFLIGEVLQPPDHFCGPPLDLLQQVHVFPVLRAPELDAVLQVGSHQSRGEGQDHLPQPTGHASFDAAQDMVGFLGCKRTLLAHVQLFIHQYPQVLLHRAALNPFIPQLVLIPGVTLNQVQDLALALVEPPEVHMGLLLELVQVPLDGNPSLRHVNHTTQLGVILHPNLLRVHSILLHWAVDHYPLDMAIQPIPYPPNSPSIKSVSLQFRDKDVVGDHVKGLTEVQIGLYAEHDAIWSRPRVPQ
ncbi:hypothetical protein QYF61_011051 [Mycteria americana]|uniref:Uncharacterized protein n=1 Tax=Mycteria americana TaxID=33587 RepID=A0AAN7MTZ5_MYCAM|nr:hypothetical protein QYF61_011051 [Mycteria americana]